MDNSEIKVYVGMSGGVDSSLTAALLKERGYHVVGVYMKNWTQDLPGMKCPWAEDLADAKRVAVQLGIDFKVFDFETEYREKVVQYMIDEYSAGRTPNPDIMCNQEVKFKLFLEAALEDGADMIATGHYAGTRSGELLRAKDDNKDQTYFLYRVRGEALEKTLLPLGEFTKPEVRVMAEERGLFTASKKDSQGICFVGKIGIRDFLKQFIPEQKPGKIIEQKTGETVGYHDGAIFYTLGQRHGLNIGGGLPFYVCGKDMSKNEVYVTTDLNNGELWTREIKLSSIHWINQPANTAKSYQIRVRHRAPLIESQIEFDGENLILKLEDEQRAVTPGQSVVIYDGEICLGGGIVI
ncbi:MAG: tRNA 2-thiouridine(34) synthase MnmA [Candidatus Sacchiramonaceae bacterium]|nr:tRNA 2-thiouridine(34) synthase MnmA [Candidatus Saccharimonadaceae bacterium]